MGLLAATAGAAKETLGVERIAAVADMGYYKGEDIEACEANGIIPYVARPQRGSAIANGRFPKERFSYDPAADAYHCPGGQLLDTRYRSVTRGHVSIQYSSPAACAACAIRARCTGGRWRRINRWEKEAVLERMAIRLAAPARHSRRPPGDGRASVRLDQTVDEPGCFSDARVGECSRRVQR